MLWYGNVCYGVCGVLWYGVVYYGIGLCIMFVVVCYGRAESPKDFKQ